MGLGDNDDAGHGRLQQFLTVIKLKERREMKTAVDRWRRAVLGHAAKLRVALEHEKRIAFARIAGLGCSVGEGDRAGARPQPPLVLSSFPLGSAPFHSNSSSNSNSNSSGSSNRNNGSGGTRTRSRLW